MTETLVYTHIYKHGKRDRVNEVLKKRVNNWLVEVSIGTKLLLFTTRFNFV